MVGGERRVGRRDGLGREKDGSGRVNGWVSKIDWGVRIVGDRLGSENGWGNGLVEGAWFGGRWVWSGRWVGEKCSGVYVLCREKG